jgi:hypothetical protein
VPLYFDRCLETTTTTGTGDITTAGAITGYRTLNSGYGTLVNIPYCIEAVDANGVPTGDWETGQGTLSTTTNFQRSRVYASSNSNALVSFAAGTKRIFATIPAERGFTQGQGVARVLRMENP